MDEVSKMIAADQDHLVRIRLLNEEVIARGDFQLAFSNIATAAYVTFTIALQKWRLGQCPRSDIIEVLAIADRLATAATDWNIDEEVLVGNGNVWIIGRHAAYLTDLRGLSLPAKQAIIREKQSKHVDVRLNYALLDIIECNEENDDWQNILGILRSKKCQSLAAETYDTYFSLLLNRQDPAFTDVLVRKAEDNYARRSRDRFFIGGPFYAGGGPDNPCVVDFQLACILKAIDWQGESIHKWSW